MACIRLEGIHKHFKEGRPSPLEKMWVPPAARSREARPRPFAITGLDLTIPDGKTMVIVGPSGCGKTTLLRLIAGLDTPDAGSVLYDDVDMKDRPPRGRGIGMVFQNYALYPHMDGKRNILSNFLFRKKSPELDADAAAKLQRTGEMMGVEIEWLLGRMPKTLSGGEKQRVAVARCITRDPELFLMDEPFSNLDAKLRERYRLQLKRLLHEFSITAVYVTHDQTEARILADLVAVLRDGRVEQSGTYTEIYNEPANSFVAEFLNLDPETPAINLFPGEWLAGDLTGRTVGVRSEDWHLSAKDGLLEAQVEWIKPAAPGKDAVFCLRREGQELYAGHAPAAGVSEGGTARLTPARYHVFDEASGRRLETRQG